MAISFEAQNSTRRWNGFVVLALGMATIAIAFILVLSNWHIISKVHFELGDFAANSLLIQDAKSFSLLKGHYSRVGFNHPGPVILYQLAMGELVFYDLLKIAPSPFAGQLIAVGCISAFWIAVIGVLLYQFSRSLLTSMLVLAVFLAASAYADYHFFTGMWFPHMFYLPFAAFMLALAPMVYGRIGSLPVLAISCGVLIHGHVSFVPILGIMVAGALMANHVLSRAVGENDYPRLLSIQFFHSNRRPLLASFGLLLVFFVPLVLESIIHFPGPVPKYASFGASNKGNGIAESVKFVASFWGTGGTTLLLSAVLLGYLYICAKSKEYSREVTGILVVILVATLGVLFYAKGGIDDLTYKYVAFFYYAVPAIAVATAAYCFYEKLPLKRKEYLALVVIVTGLGSVYPKIIQMPGYMSQYNNDQVAGLYERMRSLGPSTLVLDPDNRNGWGHIWSTLLGVEAHAKRMNVPLFCINKNWHISFTEEARCTDRQIREGTRFSVAKAGPNATYGQTPSMSFLDLSFYPFELPLVTGKQSFLLKENKALFDQYLLARGWTGVDGDFVWSIGKESVLQLRLKPNSAKKIQLDLEAFLPKEDSVQNVTVKVNDVVAGNITFTRQDNRGKRVIHVPENLAEVVELKFIIAAPISPRKAKVSKDRRLLGIALYGLGFE